MAGHMPRRSLGRTGERVSVVGIGGHHLGVPKDPGVSVELVRRALDAGVNFLDNSWDYHDGESERRMGAALRDGYRDKAFVMTKLDSRSREGARRQLHESLERLGVDRIDLVQVHEVIREQDPDRVFAENGAMETLLEARDEGLLRFIGFTGHKDPAIHLRMIYLGLQNGSPFDACQMPINAMDVHYRSFRQMVVPVCQEHDIGVIGMKPIGAGEFVGSAPVDPVEYLRWAMSQPVSTVVTGCESFEILEQALDAARDFEPLSAEEQRDIEERTRAVGAHAGRYELYKTATTFDATAYDPEWLE